MVMEINISIERHNETIMQGFRELIPNSKVYDNWVALNFF